MSGSALEAMLEHNARRRILRRLLEDGPATARKLAETLKLRLVCARHHLRLLGKAGLVGAGDVDLARAGEVIYTDQLENFPDWVREAVFENIEEH